MSFDLGGTASFQCVSDFLVALAADIAQLFLDDAANPLVRYVAGSIASAAHNDRQEHKRSTA